MYAAKCLRGCIMAAVLLLGMESFTGYAAGFFGKGNPLIRRKSSTAAARQQISTQKELVEVLVKAIAGNDVETMERLLTQRSKEWVDQLVAQNKEQFSDRRDFLKQFMKELQNGIVEEFKFASASEVLYDQEKFRRVVNDLLEEEDAADLFVQKNGRWYFSFESMIEQGDAAEVTYGAATKELLAKEFLMAVYNDDTEKFWQLMDEESRQLFEEELTGNKEYSSRREMILAVLAEIRKIAQSESGVEDLDIKKMLTNEEVVRVMVKAMLEGQDGEEIFIEHDGRYYLSFSSSVQDDTQAVDHSSKNSIAKSFIIAVVKGDRDMMWACFSPAFQDFIDQNLKQNDNKVSRKELLDNLISVTRDEIKNDYSLKNLDGLLDNQKLIDDCVRNITDPSKNLFKKIDGKWYVDSREQ